MLLLCALIVGSMSAWAADVTYDFSQIDGFSNWGSSYSKHEVNYTDAVVTFASANKQSNTITDIPVTKGGDVTLVTKNDKIIKDVTFTCRQWGSKAQTITLHYSTDGGETYTSTGVTSTNFTITKSELPSGTNAVKITFSSTSNQVGIASAAVSFAAAGPQDLTKFEFDSPTPSISLTKGNGSYDGTYTQTVSFLPNTYTGDIYYWIDYDNSTFSNDEAEVDISTGEVTIMRESNVGGTIKVVASGEAVTDMFNEPDDATYTLTVNPYKPAAPSFSTEGGAVDYGSTLSLTSDYTIKYTTDGTTTPTASVGTTYENPIVLKDACTVKAVAIDGNDVSDVASFDFTIKTPDNVTVTPAGGSSTNKTPVQYGTQVTMTHPLSSLGTIRYTTNGTIPANQIAEHPDKVFPYTGPITITADIRIKPQFQTDNGLYWSASAPDNYYTIATPVAPTPSETSGTEVAKNTVITLSHALLANSLGKIYYTVTTDGTEPADPTAESTEYTDGITIDVDKKVKARFITNGSHLGEIASLEYTYIRTAAGLAYATPSYEVPVNSAFTTPELTNPNGLTITYSSSNPTIASVDAATGNVTINAVEGDVTIYARSDRDATYYAGEASYTITVYDPTVPGTQWNPFTVTEALAFTESLGQGHTSGDNVYYVKGIVSYAGSVSSNKQTFYISDNGEESNELRIYQGKYLNQTDFTSSNKLEIGDEIVAVGQLEYYSYNGDTSMDMNDGYLTYFKRRLMPNLAFGGESEKTVTLTKGEELPEVAFTKAEGISNSDITFTASYSAVASVSNTGVITLGGSTGTSVITATFTKNDDYNAGKAICTITVNPAGVTPEPSASGYYVKVTSTNELINNAKYLFVNETALKALNGANLVDGTANVMTIAFDEDNPNHIVSSESVNNAAFTYNSSTSSFKSSQNKYLTGGNKSISGSDSEEESNNTIEFDTSGNIKLNNNSSYLRYNTDGPRFRYYTSYSTCDNVQLYKFVPGESPENIDIYVSEAGMATYASNFDLDYSNVSGLKAYIAKDVNGVIMQHEVSKVPAGTGVLLCVSDGGGKSYAVPTATGTLDNVEDNLFKRGTGASVASVDGTKHNYILNVVDNELGFYRAAGQTVATNRAYLQTTVDAARIALTFDDEANGIAENEIMRNVENKKVYNLSGQRVDNPKKGGLYIVNGKKVIKN